jgi:hypothetical protein
MKILMQKVNANTRKGYVSHDARTYSSIVGYNTSSNPAKERSVSSLIQSYILAMKNPSLLCSKPVYTYTSTKVSIVVFYYVSPLAKDTFGTKGSQSLFSLSDSLVSIYGKEVSLTFTRIHYPYLNSYVFAQYLMHNSPTNTFIHFKDSILTYPSKNASLLPASICGIKIEVSGRLVTEAVVPRVSKKTYQFGSAASALVDYSKFTGKNFLGSFTIKV